MTASVGQPQSSPATKTVDSFEVGWLFVQEYYTFLNKNPKRLHQFYNKSSFFLHGYESEAERTCHGQQEIHDRILELDFEDCKVLVSNVDSQASLKGGIIVQVLGEMSNKGGPTHKFAQTFFLAEQPNGYYVLNDIFRFLKEDIDNDYENTAEPDAVPLIQDEYVVEQETADLGGYEDEVYEASRSPSPAKEEYIHLVEPAVPVSAPASVEVESWTPEPVAEKPKTWAAPKADASPEQKATVNGASATAVTETAQAATAPTQTVHEAAAPLRERSPVRNPAPKQQATTPQASPQQTSNSQKAPMSWSSIAQSGGGRVQASPSKVAPVSKVVPPGTAGTPAPAHIPKEPVKATEDAESSPVDSNAEDGKESQQGFREVSNRRYEHRRSFTTKQQPDDDLEKRSIYIRNVPESMDYKEVKAVFLKFGPVSHVEVIKNKQIAFVEFPTPELAQKAIGQTFSLRGVQVVAEERKKPRGRGQGGDRPPYNNGRQSAEGGANGGHYEGGGRGRGRGGRGRGGGEGRGEGGGRGNSKPTTPAPGAQAKA
ncbi:hypothetical protein BJ742DRAFT_737359 [Cladochytrium replicatum]|nr:hypothetical protein BJ742DRAFT_737359 [Cladochytrium replicatum]